MSQLIERIGGTEPPQLPGYRLRVIDGNCLAGTDHRLKVLHSVGAVALPGKSLVVLDPQLRLAVNVFPGEDGHAQERSLFDEVLKTVQAGELWIGDRARYVYSQIFVGSLPARSGFCPSTSSRD